MNIGRAWNPLYSVTEFLGPFYRTFLTCGIFKWSSGPSICRSSPESSETKVISKRVQFAWKINKDEMYTWKLSCEFHVKVYFHVNSKCILLREDKLISTFFSQAWIVFGLKMLSYCKILNLLSGCIYKIYNMIINQMLSLWSLDIRKELIS